MTPAISEAMVEARKPRAYYNEIDPDAVAVLRQCIADGVLAPGEVDTRSIKDVQADDLRGFTQCHFFAGGGFWSVAARMAGWPDARPLWTGSCPCQPFSAAGKGRGTDDPRHLWPDFHRLIRACRPPLVMGEQVAGAPGYGWFDGVSADLASEGYASRSVDIPACAIDAPHQRNRLYWVAVADAEIERRRGDARELRSTQGGGIREVSGQGDRWLQSGPVDEAGAIALGDAFGSGLEGQSGHGDELGRSEQDRSVAAPDGSGTASQLADAERDRRGTRRDDYASDVGAIFSPANQLRNGSYWADAEWIVCHDGKARRTKPGLRLLVDGLPGRVGLWRVGGNAISPVLAAEVIGAYLETERLAA